MTPAEYLDSVKERLLTDPIVVGFQVRRERRTATDGHLRVRVAILDGSLLEFSEYAERTPDGQMQVAVYSYHSSGLSTSFSSAHKYAKHCLFISSEGP